MAEHFDPRAHLRKISSKNGPVDYLDVAWRIVWLRTEHPDAVIERELIHFDAEGAVVKARVAIPNGGEASDYGSETKVDFKDYLEKASTKALGRALAALGYGTQFCDDLDADRADADPRDWKSLPAPQETPPRSYPPAAGWPAAATSREVGPTTPRTTRQTGVTKPR